MTATNLKPTRPRSTIRDLAPGLFCLILAALIAVPIPAQAGRDDEYFDIFAVIQQADSLSASGKAEAAAKKYQEAQAALLAFRKRYPDFNAKMVSFRLNYVAEKLAPPPEKVSPPTTANETGTSSSTSAQTVAVKILEPGAEPRKALRIHPKAGDKQVLSVTLKIGMVMKSGDMQSQPMDPPAMTINLDTLVKKVSEDGDVTYEIVLGDSNGLNGISGSGTISSRGINRGTQLSVPTDAAPQIRQVMEQAKDSFTQFLIPLPEEPIGVGAKWEVKRPIKLQGMIIDQTTTYELVSIEDERLAAKVTSNASAANQKIQNPAMPGLKMDLSKLTGQGNGELKLDLNHILPQSAVLDSKSEFSMRVNTGGQQQNMSMKLDVNAHLETK